MSKAKNTQSKNPAGQSLKTRSLASFFSGSMVIAAVIMLLSAALAYVLQSRQVEQAMFGIGETAVNTLVTHLQDSVSARIEVLNLLAADPRVAELLELKDHQQLSDYAEFLQKNLKNMGQVRLLPKDYSDTDKQAQWPLTFASLDQVRRAESGKTVAAEFHSLNSKKRHVAITRKVENANGELVGVVQLALKPGFITRILDKHAVESVGVVLSQQVGQKMVELARSANMPEGADGLQGATAIKGSIWKLSYKNLSPHGLLDFLLLPAVLLVGLLVIIVMSYLMILQIRKALKTDQASLVRLVEAKLQGKSKTAITNAALAENKDTLVVIGGMTPASGAVAKSKQEHKAGQKAGSDEAEVHVPMPGDDERKSPEPQKTAPTVNVSAEIFREYDIRGVVGENLTTDIAKAIGQAFGSLAYEKGEQSILVARDGRESSEEMANALIKGLVDSGRDVIYIGMIPTPLLYFATEFLSANSGVMVTASHNPGQYNGFKIVLEGQALTADELKDLRMRMIRGDVLQGEGTLDRQDIKQDYIMRVNQDVRLLKPMNVIIDCGNGVAGEVASALLQSLGCDVKELYCEVDGSFPNHHPNPGDPDNLQDLINAVKDNGADLGIAFDGDGDRIGVVDSSGNIIWPDRLLMLLAADVLLRNPGADILYDVKSSKYLASHVLATGGRPIMWKTGHSLMKAKMKETGAVLGGEFSGHIFFQERWYGFDDALYVAARLLETLSGDGRDTTEIFAELPSAVATHELLMDMQEGQPQAVMQKLEDAKPFPGAKIIDIDGLRAEYPDGWGLVRSSNTSAALVFRFEAGTDAGLAQVQQAFREALEAVAPGAKLPF